MESFAALTLVHWLHMMATIAWIGGMLTNFMIVVPSIGKSLDPPSQGKFIGVLMKRFRIMVYLSIFILILTGFAISGPSDDYGNYFDFSESTGIYFTIKHLIIFLMVILSIVSFEVVGPKVGKLAMAGPSRKLNKLRGRQKTLGFVGFLMGITIVLLSAMMMAA